MICNNPNHDINCRYHNNNALKGASAVNQQQPGKQFAFNPDEVNLLGESLQFIRNFIIKNQSQYQQNPQDIVNEINQSLKILKSRNSLKGASACNKNPYKSLDSICKMVGLN